MTVDEIKDMVADFYGVRVRELVGKSKKKGILRPRYVLMRLLYTKGLTLKEVGMELSGRDHSTVSAGIGNVDNEVNEGIEDEYGELLLAYRKSQKNTKMLIHSADARPTEILFYYQRPHISQDCKGLYYMQMV